ncbi:MAG: hypothetical protein U0821_01190 [Chloroflexota bacterium]
MLARLADSGPAPTWREALAVGTVAAIWSLLFRGFDGGRWSDIPIIKSFVDPRLYVHDPFIYSLHDGTPAAYTYQFIALVVGALSFTSLDAALFVLYLPTSVVSLAIVYRIALHLAGNRFSATVVLALYIASFRLTSVGSAILHSAELTPAFLALPLQLAGLYGFLTGRHLLAGAATGLALNVHAPTTSYVGGAIGIAYLLGIRGAGVRAVAVAGFSMLLCGMPAILGSVTRHTDALPGWALQLARIELATDLSVLVNWDRLPLRAHNLAGLALLGLGLLSTGQRQHRWSVLRIVVGVIALCAVSVVFIDLYLRGPVSTLVARLQFPRAAWLVNVLGLPFVASYLVRAWQDGSQPRTLVLTLFGAMLVSPSDFSPAEPLFLSAALAIVLIAAAQRWTTLPTRSLEAVGPALVAAVASARAFGTRYWIVDLNDGLKAAAMAAALLAGWGLWLLLKNRTGEKTALGAALFLALLGAWGIRGSTDWLFELRHRGGLNAAAEFQQWASEQTPIDSVFLILPSEPNNETFYKNANRALFLMRERANQAVYFTAHNYEFRDRVLAIGGTDVLRYREELDSAYRRLTEERIREMGRLYGVTHFVPARTAEFTFPVVYQRGGWTVYKVSDPP